MYRVQPAVRQQQLDSLVRFFASIALRRNTRSTYSTHHRTFARLCAATGVDPNQPITEKQLCETIILYAARHKITTVSGFVSAIQNWATDHGHAALPRGDLYRRVRDGLDNYYGNNNFAEQKTALTLDDLCAFRPHLQLSSFEGARDWCACLFGFFGLLRIGEYTGGALTAGNVRSETWGVGITVMFSKTSLIPTAVDLVRRDDQLCPLAAYQTYVAFIPAALRQPHQPFFLAKLESPAPLTEAAFISRLRNLIRVSLHIDPTPYAGHSFRRGGTTAMYLAGVPEASIAVHGRWRSMAYRSYFDTARNQRMRLVATAKLRLHSANYPLAPRRTL